MRKICIALCLSLFASLIHAAVMPIEQPVSQSSASQTHHQVAAADNSAHHCDEVTNNTSDSNSKQPCHGDSYQCCLGLVFISPFAVLAPADFSAIPAANYSSLALQSMINCIYKPPKS
ncbi:hypothetical protein ICN10_01830 [Polynucleobacter sp. 86C-FISCH]|uniref:hypothetical protein n=1 Tax=Polynucleobacter sp. 86C-FISCH TaxID=2689101 RepID=UPI001C0D4255|nr:hypothetical protein [Polynucleobacter sp. 86C-FISCH]MBU3595137.1 hypothetical protein [Polynucleobacter sp. 86C-FISCH]